MSKQAEFDAFAEDYDLALEQGLSATGESKEYFAEGRIVWLNKYLVENDIRIASVMDYGCGTGSSTRLFFDILKADEVVGLDVSRESLRVARDLKYHPNARFESFEDFTPNADIDLAFCNGVFHHIPPAERRASLDYIYRALRPGALFAFWENNPWNPGTRYVMSRCPFDANAITLNAPEARKLLIESGFKIISMNFLFIFPRILSPLRRLEPLMSRLPIGAQYQVLCRKD